MNDATNGSPSTMSKPATRRDFLRRSAIGLAVPIAGTALAACQQGSTKTPPSARATSNAAPPASQTRGTLASPAPAANPRAAADAMDAMHEKRMKAFPRASRGRGNQPLEPRITNGVKISELTTSGVRWEVEPGNAVGALAYNGQVPGPQIRMREGNCVRVIVKNGMRQSTTVHWHGVEVPNDQDGVSFLTQPPIKPGETYTHEFTAPNPGSHMYHSHHNAAEQVGKGLLGAFIIEPRQRRAIERVDVDYVMIIDDGYHGYTLNGKSFPAIEPILAKLGQQVRIRFMNEGVMIHPMHLHGLHMTIIDKDGWPLPAPFRCDTINVTPGERWDAIVGCSRPGAWALHCHILPHAENPSGMVTALMVMQGRPAAAGLHSRTSMGEYA